MGLAKQQLMAPTECHLPAVVASPCTQVYVGYQPDNRHVDTWIIALDGTARQPGWRATFNRHTPAELVIDLLTSMVNRSTLRPSTTTSSTS